MSDTNPKATPPAGDEKAKKLSAADAAKMVKRLVVTAKKGEDGQPVIERKLVAVKPAEVLAFKDYGSHVVVVTVDGQKFSSADAAAETAEA